MSAERIDRMRPASRAKLYYAVGVLSSAIALLWDAYGPMSVLAYVPLAAAAAFLFDRLVEELRLMRQEPRS